MQALGQVWDEAPTPHVDETYTVLPEPTHGDARLLFDEWRKHTAQSGFIVGRHVPSRELVSVLPGLCLFEPLRGGLDFRVRLAGTALRRRFGRDITGMKLSNLFHPMHLDHHCAQMAHIGRTGAAHVLAVRSLRDGRVRLHFELMGLRVLAADGRTPWIMTGQFFYDALA